MLNYRVKCLIFSELSSSKIGFFDFLAVPDIFSVSLGVVMNIAHPKHPPDRTQTAKGYGGKRSERAKKPKCDSKKFFFVKFSRSVCEDCVGIALRGRVADEVLVVKNM